ncbi:DUF4932 domain-containing protein [Cecembia calidifontis]|nr:DUF4932 domain-containing protein [Cecembia calidifontis]
MSRFLATNLTLLMILVGVFGTENHLSAQRLPSAMLSEHHQIQLRVSPQVELISILQSIGNYPEILPFLVSAQEFSYRQRALEHFGPFSGHAAVKMFDRLSAQPRKLNFNAPSYIMLFTNQVLQLRNDIELDEFVLNRIDGQDSLLVFLDLLKDFVEVSGFSDFFSQNEKYYFQTIDQAKDQIGDFNFIRELEDFYGQSQHSYHIVLVSLYPALGFGNSLLRHDGKREIYNVMGAGSIKEDIPFFGDEIHFRYMIRHEFSHPFVNPLTEMHRDKIMPYSENFESLPENARQHVCGEWEECINEFIIRAITTWLARQECESLGDWAYQREKSRGVPYLDELLEKIDAYQNNRKQYPTLQEYYPELLKIFMNPNH